MRVFDQATQIIRWGLVALLLASCSAGTNAQRLGVGIGLTRIHQKGNTSPPPPVSSVTYDTSIGLSVDANGRADLTPRVGAQIFYVNSTTGNDTNTCTQAKSASTPKATIKSAESCVIDGEGDQVLIAEGTSYPLGLAYIGDKGGFSAQYPVVYQSYDPADPTNQAKWGAATGTNRPVINPTGSDMTGGFIQGGGTSKKYRAFRGLDFDPGSNIGDVGLNAFTNTAGTPDGMLFENDIFAYTSLNLDFTGTVGVTGNTQHIIFRKSAFYGAYGTSLNDHQMCSFIANTDGLTVEDSVFWHCGWKIGDTRSNTAAQGGATDFNHPLYIQDSTYNTVVRRNAFIAGSADGSNLKGGGIYQDNLSLNNPEVVAGGNGGNSPITHPFGSYLDYSYNIGIGSDITSLADGGSAQDWGFAVSNGIANGSAIHHNVLAHSSAEARSAFLPAAVTTYGVTLPANFDFHDNVSYQWNASGATIDSGVSATISTFENNLWDDPTSGSNISNSGHVFANAYTADGLAQALGYADLSTATADWIANPDQRKWENGVALGLAGYGITVPALSDLSTNLAFTTGTAKSAQIINVHDGSNLTETGLPANIVLDTNCRCVRYDAGGSASSGSATITETNGALTHNTVLPWSISAAPVLSSVAATTSQITNSTTVGSGKEYWIATSSATPPASWAYIRAGRNADTSAASFSGSQAVTASGSQTIAISGPTAGLNVYIAQLDGSNNPSAVYSTVISSAWSPASLGANLAFDFTHLDSSHLFTDTGCTTALTTDGQTAKCIKDTTTGVTATNSTGWVYHANSGKPYLQMDGVSFFRTTTSFAFTDASGQVSMWAVVAPATSGNNALLGFFGHTLLIANPGLNRSQVTAYNTTPSSIGQDFKSGTALNTAAVFSGIITTSTAEVFVDNATDGSTAISGTLYSGSTLGIDIGNTATGPFYGAWMEKAVADSTTQTNAQTYGAALHP